MKVNLCTITFRYQLIAFDDLIRFASHTGFTGIELWGVHAESLSNEYTQFENIPNSLRRNNLEVPVLSGYLNMLCEDGELRGEIIRAESLIRIAEKLGTGKIRVFAGNIESGLLTEKKRDLVISRLNFFAELMKQNGVRLIVETHPGTLADNLLETERMIADVNHTNLGINLDFFHIWEAGDDPLEAYERLKPNICHFHLKNISSRDHLAVYLPSNVFSTRGDRTGMVPVAKGILDYRPILSALDRDKIQDSLSLEWFGDEPFSVLKNDLEWIQKTMAETDKVYA